MKSCTNSRYGSKPGTLCSTPRVVGRGTSIRLSRSARNAHNHCTYGVFGDEADGVAWHSLFGLQTLTAFLYTSSSLSPSSFLSLQLVSVGSSLRVNTVRKLRSNSNVTDEENSPVVQFFKVWLATFIGRSRLASSIPLHGQLNEK